MKNPTPAGGVASSVAIVIIMRLIARRYSPDKRIGIKRIARKHCSECDGGERIIVTKRRPIIAVGKGKIEIR